MEARLWNIGVKAADVSAEIAFYLALGGRLLLRERLATPDGESEFALLQFGDTRLFVTDKPIFEDRLETPQPGGLTHAVFEVADLDPEVARLKALGAEILVAPVAISAGFGKRKIAFFRSPGGLVFEVMQIETSSPAVELS